MATTYPITVKPSFAGFSNWVYTYMGVPVAWLPADSEYLVWAYNTAISTVNFYFQCIPGPIYLQMVYNLGGHLLITWAQDTMTTPPYPYKDIDGVKYGYFQWLRKEMNVSGFVTGIVNSSSDNGSSVGLVVPEQANNLTLSQLALTTTPFGRYYLGLAQDFGTHWGIS